MLLAICLHNPPESVCSTWIARKKFDLMLKTTDRLFFMLDFLLQIFDLVGIRLQ